MANRTNFKTLHYTHSGADGDEEVSAIDVASGCLVRTVTTWRVGAGAGQKDHRSEAIVFVPGVTIVPNETGNSEWRLEKSDDR